MKTLDYQLFYERDLPHYQPAGATLFITFRLAGSIPRELLRRWAEEAKRKEMELARMADEEARQKARYVIQKQYYAKLDAQLNRGDYGPRWLEQPEIAECVCAAIHRQDGIDYNLIAYCIMPTHGHILIKPLCKDGLEIPLSRIMHRLKGSTAYQANLLLKRTGEFWQHESYDHAVRSEGEMERILHYILQNPAHAGLPARWVYCAVDL